MMLGNRSLTSASWDKEYATGRYADEPPVRFVEEIISMAPRGHGLYVGCGNGRNYVSLVRSGLDLLGIDVSEQAIMQVRDRLPGADVRHVDFKDVTGVFDYIVSIQTFQHVSDMTAREYFEHARKLLSPGGLLFLRVNSASTVPLYSHDITEKNQDGGFTILYTDGPKSGLKIHFYSLEELCILSDGFDFVVAPYEDTVRREPPKHGSWSQWEAVLRKHNILGGHQRSVTGMILISGSNHPHFTIEST